MTVKKTNDESNANDNSANKCSGTSGADVANKCSVGVGDANSAGVGVAGGAGIAGGIGTNDASVVDGVVSGAGGVEETDAKSNAEGGSAENGATKNGAPSSAVTKNGETDGVEIDGEGDGEAGGESGGEPKALDGDLAQAAAEALEAAQAEVAGWKDKYLRLHAEWDTYRRRTNEQRANEKALATEKLVNEILPVLDDFERTINYATENGEQGLLDGVRAVQTKLHGVLKKSGLEQLDPAGEPFDALQHQAVATVEDAEVFDETVNEVYQKGYKMGNKVLRPAMVTVTCGGPKRPKEDENENGSDE